MDETTQKEIDRADGKVQELHNYVRFTMQQLVGWFTFFVTVNYASMGWFAKADVSAASMKGLISLVRWMFIAQNILGIAVCIFVRRQVVLMRAQISSYEDFVELLKPADGPRRPRDECMPCKLYTQATTLMILTQAVIVVAWFSFRFFF